MEHFPELPFPSLSLRALHDASFYFFGEFLLLQRFLSPFGFISETLRKTTLRVFETQLKVYLQRDRKHTWQHRRPSFLTRYLVKSLDFVDPGSCLVCSEVHAPSVQAAQNKNSPSASTQQTHFYK